MMHEQGIRKEDARRLGAQVSNRLKEIAEANLSAAESLRRAADFLEELADELRQRALSVGVPYPPDEA